MSALVARRKVPRLRSWRVGGGMMGVYCTVGCGGDELAGYRGDVFWIV
jgi:hypothetical protein